MNQYKNHMIGAILSAITLWVTLTISTGIPMLTLKKIGALIFGLVVTSIIFFLMILVIDKITVTAVKQLVEHYRRGSFRGRVIIIVSGILVLMRIITDILR